MAHVAYGSETPFPEGTKYDFEEFCPACNDSIAIKLDPEDKSFYVYCPTCKRRRKLVFCTMCIDSGCFCDWRSKNGCHMKRRTVHWNNINSEVTLKDRKELLI